MSDNPDNGKPSDIHKKNTSKLTKRRLMKLMAASGFSGPALANISVDDVKAADSDQVPVSMDYDGNWKKMVPADWMDRMKRAEDAREKIKSNWRNNKDVFSVWLNSGEFGGENPHIEVGIDYNSNSKDETRGKIPEEKDGVPVEVFEEGKNERADNCKQCNNYDNVSVDPHIPGGVQIHIQADGELSCGTLAPMVVDADNQYSGSWVTAAHVICGSGGTADSKYLKHEGTPIGEIVDVIEFDHDFAVIEPFDSGDTGNTSGQDFTALDEVAESNDIDNGSRYEINSTLTKSGTQTAAADNLSLFKYGMGGCYNSATINADGDTFKQSTLGDPVCASGDEELTHQLRFGNDGYLSGGDSGTITFVKAPNNPGYYAASLGNGHSTIAGDQIGKAYSFGTAGWAIQEFHNYRWADGGD